MKAKKWCCIPLILILSFSACINRAFASAMVQADYESILREFNAAINAETEDESLEHLVLLQEYYEKPGRAEALEAFEGGNALLYYTYAKAMIAFEAKDYFSAWEGFNALQGVQPSSILYELPSLPDTTYYYQFSMAVLDLEYNDFAAAFEALEAARTAPGASAKACKDALEQFAQVLKAEAQSCCSRGAHEQAQEYYILYAEYVNRYEGKSLLDQCIQHSQSVELNIHVDSTDASTISLSWNGGNDTYSVSWSTDLTGNKTPESLIIKGNGVTLTGLFPGTDYHIVVSSGSSTAKPDPIISETADIVTRTLPAEKYPAKSLQALRTETAGITRYNFILSRMTPIDILDLRYDPVYEKYSCWRDDFSFTAVDVNSFALYGFASCMNLTSETIHTSMYYLLRSPTAGVYGSEKTEIDIFADTMPSGEPIPYRLPVINLDALLQEIFNDRFSFPQDQYIWEIYLDDMLFCRGSFTIK